MRRSSVVLVLLLVVLAAGCSRRQQPPISTIPRPTPPPPVTSAPTPAPAPAPQRVDESLPVPPQPLAEDEVGNRSLDDLNRDSPFQPVFFALDQADLDDPGRAIAQGNAELLKKYATWVITVEGHCDERGTAEYNLALGERRSVAVKTYLVSLGINPNRIRTVSYGKEFPFDPGHNEEAWAKNRRAHFVITSK
jgi:peptidoglycan-associated lipoprotein